MSPARLAAPSWSTPALAVAGVALLALVLFGQLPGEARWQAEFTDFGHVPTFALLSLVILALVRRVAGAGVDLTGLEYVVAFALALAIGVLIEFVQDAIGRDATVSDIVRDAIGAALGVGVAAARDPRIRRGDRLRRILWRTCLAVGAIGTLAAMAPTALSMAAHREQQQMFPTLLRFDSPLGTRLINFTEGLDLRRKPLPQPLRLRDRPEDATALRVDIRALGNKWWGLFLFDPPRDWREYRQLKLDLANPTDAVLVLSLRVRDAAHDSSRDTQYSGQVTVPPHSRLIHDVPLSQFAETVDGVPRVDASNVDLVLLARSRKNLAEEFYLVRMWLE